MGQACSWQRTATAQRRLQRARAYSSISAGWPRAAARPDKPGAVALTTSIPNPLRLGASSNPKQPWAAPTQYSRSRQEPAPPAEEEALLDFQDLLRKHDSICSMMRKL